MSQTPEYREVLVPTDGSDTARAAINHAIGIAHPSEATIHAVYVVDRRITLAAEDTTRTELEEALTTEGTEALDTVEELAEQAGLSSTRSILEGTPWKEILDYADSHQIDVIVMGDSGRSPRETVMRMGSVSERVVDNALVPVLVVPDVNAG